MDKPKRIHKPMSSFQIITLGFLMVILVGSLILMLPISTRGVESASFLEAFFTATSATCVTGLVVQDTATFWSPFGQAVILILIQIGGLGIVTLAIVLSMLTGKKIGLHQRQTMVDAISAPQVGGIIKLTKFIFITVIVIEATGAVLLMPVFIKEFGVLKGIWFSFFHSISAFCNGGFDLMGGKEKFSSLTSYSDSIYVNVVIMLLIIIGGISFLVWDDFAKHKFRFKKYRMQSKVALTVSGILILLPAIYFYFCEFGGKQWGDISVKERILDSVFQSVTTRTAGFNTADFDLMSDSGKLISIVLMLIGGSPGSTAGGLKTTTVAVLILTAISVFRRKNTGECFGRRIPMDAINYAATILMMYLTLCVTGAVIINRFDGVDMLTALFESASAIGTVGVTLGITSTLGTVSRITIIIMMYLGRVGGLTLVFAALSGNLGGGSKLPEEKITVG